MLCIQSKMGYILQLLLLGVLILLQFYKDTIVYSWLFHLVFVYTPFRIKLGVENWIELYPSCFQNGVRINHFSWLLTVLLSLSLSLFCVCAPFRTHSVQRLPLEWFQRVWAFSRMVSELISSHGPRSSRSPSRESNSSFSRGEKS